MTTRVVNKYKESYDVDITRAGKWGNPYKVEKDKSGKEIPGSRERAIYQFGQYITQRVDLLKLIPVELKDKTLGCVCKPKPCHGDLLAELANSNSWDYPLD